MQFLYVKVPVVNRVRDRTRQLEDKIDDVLKQAGVGAVAGWGDSLGAAMPDGSRPVAYTRIDVDVSDLASARALLRPNLAAFGAPDGTEIHYTMDHRRHMDVYSEPDWLLHQPC
jgi:hypothetical protein